MPSATASQTIGPYWHLLEDPSWADLTRFGAQGERITLTGARAGRRRQAMCRCLRGDLAVRPAGVGQFPGFRPQQHRRAGRSIGS